MATTSGNHLADENSIRRQQYADLRDQLLANEARRPRPPARASLGLGRIEAAVIAALTPHFPDKEQAPQFKYLDRKTFAADVAVTIPGLLKHGGPKAYIAQYLPTIVSTLVAAFQDSPLVESVEAKGMYVNIKIRDSYLLSALNEFTEAPFSVVENTAELSKRIVIDYSAPNVAKKLHAGHIRSTIVGHILANIHQACGAAVFRVNHINDLGGFGFLIEGLKRWGTTVLAGMSDEVRVVELYRIRRTLEKLTADSAAFASATAEERALVTACFGSEASQFTTLSAAVRDYAEISDQAFERLEHGAPQEVAAWKEIVEWSLKDFATFYDALNIKIDFTIGESFYLDAGNALVEELLRSKLAVVYSSDDYERDIASYAAEKEAGKISDAEFAVIAEEAKGSIGAVIIRLSKRRRLVVRRSDGRSIYITRDIGALCLRYDIFSPQQMIYVVGQEQKQHFADLFEAASLASPFKGPSPELLHVYFGFYVDAQTKKKLSSRDGASSVNQLLQNSVNYFLAKLEATDFPQSEKQSTAKELAIASLVFNDLEKDIKGTVEIDLTSSTKTIEKFERAGGAYVIYTACRANALVTRFRGEQARPEYKELKEPLSNDEIELMIALLRSDEITAQTAQSNNPSHLVRHLINLAQSYSSYYSNYPVFRREGVYVDRVAIAAAVHRALVDGLSLCNVRCPKRI